MSGHKHQWSALVSHFGPYGDQEAHYHVCLHENPHPQPGYGPYDCGVMLVGVGRYCEDGCAHEEREPERRVRTG